MKTDELPPIVINGREYPLWSQFVHRKAEWIGGRLQDLDMGEVNETKITDVILHENGKDSAWFEVRGDGWGCGFDVQYGGVTGGKPDWLTFCGYGGHTWRIQKKGDGAS